MIYERHMDQCEKLAKAAIEHVIPGSKMEFHLEQAHGNYDFDLVYPDGRLAAVEVTAAKNELMEGTTAAILDERKGGPFVPRHKCHNDWMVCPILGANINRIRDKVDEYLAEIEAEGRSHFFAYVDFNESPAVRRILEDLQIEIGDVTEWRKPSFNISLPGQGAKRNPKEVNVAVLREAQKQDNRRKLQKAVHPEKHLFVCIDWRLYSPWYAINEGKPSSLPMQLPEGIDIVWAVARTRSSGVYTIWRAKRDHPWEVLEAFENT